MPSERSDKSSSPKAVERTGFLRCRLCRQVGIAVFVSILLLEGAILSYFSRDFERERLEELERVNFAAIQSLFVGAAPGMEWGILADVATLMRATDIRGGALYKGSGQIVGVFGEPPETRLYEVSGTEGGRLLADGTRYEGVWRFSMAQPLLTMVMRLDASGVKAAVADFFWRILGLVVVISVIVTAVTMFILDRLTLAPVLLLRQALLAAGDDPSDPGRHKVVLDRDDELGEVFGAFNQMLERLSASNREIKHRQVALAESEERFRDIAESASDWFWEMGPDLRYTFISELFFKETGMIPGDIIGMTQMEFVGPEIVDENPDVWQTYEKNLRDRVSFRNVEYAQKDAGGRHRIVSVSGKPLFDSDGAFAGYRGTATDVTDHRQAESDLMHLRKMESLGSLAGGIAHNLNNMLQPVLVLSELTRNKMPKESKEREDLEMVIQAGGRIRELVDQIAVFSRSKGLNRKKVDIFDVTREGLNLIYSVVPSTVTVTEDLDRDTGIVFADATQTQTVLMNLVSNAVDAMEGNTGELKISLSPAHVHGSVAHSVPGLDEGFYAKLTVADTGHGMDENTLSRIFDPFFTTKDHGKGTGLGLSSAFGTIFKHGGTIRASSTLGQGATFEVYLPLEQINVS